MSMLPVGLLLAMAGPAAEPVAASGAGLTWPADAVVLVVAGWCAPCHEELTRLDAIGAAAGGRKILVVGLDTTAGTRAMMLRVPSALRWQPSATERATLRDAVYGASTGLPYAVATDSRGRACADAVQPLNAIRTRTLVARCARVD